MHCVIVFILVIAVTSIVIRNVSAKVTSSQRRIFLSSRLTKLEWIPKTWNWFDVSKEEASSWSFAFGRKLLPGVYASQAINQHETGYCGCCFMIASIQCIQDAYNIRYGNHGKSSDEFDHRIFHFDMNKAMNDFTRIHKANVVTMENAGMQIHNKASREWNACMGGDPIDVLNSLADKRMMLKLRHGHTKFASCTIDDEQENFRGGYSIRSCSYLMFDDILTLKREILKAPVIVGIRALNLWDIQNGVVNNCNGSAGADRDHVVCIVGWKEHHWICRNSWGNENHAIVWSRPDDVRGCMTQCGKSKDRTCQTNQIVWKNDFEIPGVFLVPMDKFENCAGIYDEPTGWIQVELI